VNDLQGPIAASSVSEEDDLLDKVVLHGQSRAPSVATKPFKRAMTFPGPGIDLLFSLLLLKDHDVAFFPVSGLFHAFSSYNPLFPMDLRTDGTVHLHSHHLTIRLT
jgi:hypothetical protein